MSFEELFSTCKQYIEDEEWERLESAINSNPLAKVYARGDDSLLFHARDLGSAAVRRTVLAGISPNIRYTDGTTVLMEYASMGNLKMVQFLLGNGANVNAVASGGETAFSWSCVSDELTCAQELHANGGRWNSSAQTAVELAQAYDASDELIVWLKSLE